MRDIAGSLGLYIATDLKVLIIHKCFPQSSLLWVINQLLALVNRICACERGGCVYSGYQTLLESHFYLNPPPLSLTSL